MTEPTPAASVLLMRDTANGPALFMLQRHRRSGFMPHMWVFPGGRRDEADGDPHGRILGGQSAAEAFGIPLETARALLVCGVRETFEESGVWLGAGHMPEAAREELHSGAISLAQALDRYELSVDLDTLLPWARWVTPPGEGRRFDAFFFVAVVESDAGRHDETETVDSAWLTPGELFGGGISQYPLAPPTWSLVRGLRAHGKTAELAQVDRDLSPVQPRPEMGESGLVMHMPERADLPPQLALQAGGWVPRNPDGSEWTPR